MNLFFCRTLKAFCVASLAVLLSACGSSSTVDPFIATRVIAFGDGFNYVDANGSGVSTVRTSIAPAFVTDDTLVGRIAARIGIVVKQVGPANSLASQGGFSYATANARVADVDRQVTTFLNSAGSVSKGDLIVIAVGNWDIYDAVKNGATSMETATTTLAAAIQRLTNAGAEHVVVVPPINMARTPWATTYVTENPSVNRLMIQNLSNSAKTSFNFLLALKLNTMYTQDRKPVAFLDRTTDFNGFAGSVDINGAAIQNFSGTALTNLATPVCATPSPATGCALADTGATGLKGGPNSTDYLTSVFADEINLTPALNRYLADRVLLSLISFGWSP